MVQCLLIVECSEQTANCNLDINLSLLNCIGEINYRKLSIHLAQKFTLKNNYNMYFFNKCL